MSRRDPSVALERSGSRHLEFDSPTHEARLSPVDDSVLGRLSGLEQEMVPAIPAMLELVARLPCRSKSRHTHLRRRRRGSRGNNSSRRVLPVLGSKGHRAWAVLQYVAYFRELSRSIIELQETLHTSTHTGT